MANPEITDNTTRTVQIWEPVWRDGVLTATAAQTWPAGTVLGRLTADDSYTIYASGAADGSETPVAVLTYEVVFDGAGTTPGRVLVSGHVRENDLSAFGVGALTETEVEELRDYTIIARRTTQLTQFDNPNNP